MDEVSVTDEGVVVSGVERPQEDFALPTEQIKKFNVCESCQ